MMIATVSISRVSDVKCWMVRGKPEVKRALRKAVIFVLPSSVFATLVIDYSIWQSRDQ